MNQPPPDRRIPWLRALGIALLAGAWVVLFALLADKHEATDVRWAVDLASPFLAGFLLHLALVERLLGRRPGRRSLGRKLGLLAGGWVFGALFHLALLNALYWYKDLEPGVAFTPGTAVLAGAVALWALWMPDPQKAKVGEAEAGADKKSATAGKTKRKKKKKRAKR